MLSRSQAFGRRPAAPAPISGRPGGRFDPSRGRGNAAMIEQLSRQTSSSATRGLELDVDPASVIGTANNPGSEHHLDGEGDLLFASSTSASMLANDDGSYTQRLMEVQAEHPEWSLHEVIRHVNSLDVNGTGSELALTAESSEEAGSGVGFKAAVVVGNQNYAELPSLEGAGADAAGMANMLGAQGYEVEHLTDRTGAELTSDLGEAGVDLGEGDELLIYYAGHGYTKGLLGVDAPKDASSGVVPTSALLGEANRVRGAGVKTEVVLDACKSGAQVEALVAEDDAAKATLGAPITEGEDLGANP